MMETEQPVLDTDSAAIEDRIADKFFPRDQEPEPEAQDTDAPEQEGAEEPKAEGEKPASDEDSQYEEVEFEGSLYKLPKELKEALLRQSDYTRKTQEVAEARRVVESRARALEEQRAFEETVKEDLQQLGYLETEIARLAKMDWSSMDTNQLLQARMALDTIKDERDRLKSALQEKRQKFSEQLQARIAEMRAAGERVLQSSIPGGWNESRMKEVAAYGISEGYTAEELSSVYDPRYVRTLWKAMQWDKLQASKGALKERAAKAPPVVKPGASSPEMSQRMERLNFRKQLKQASTPQAKAELIRKRLERMV